MSALIASTRPSILASRNAWWSVKCVRILNDDPRPARRWGVPTAGGAILVGVGSGSCPVLVGRDAELAELVSGLDAAVSGRGGAIVLVGEAGIGKSRLAQETTANARRRGMNVLAGRAVEGGRVVVRPLHEALLAHLRTAGPPATPELVAFRPALARLVPEWRSPGRPPAEESLVVLGEAVVRLLRVVAGQDGCLLVLEDLHWADPESLEIFEYLADNIATEPVLCVGTFRTGEAGGALARARQLSARRAATIVDVDRLTDTEVVEMAAACLGEPVLSEQVRDVLRSAADGVPFFVEELLADAAAAVGSTLAVPVSFAETVRRRLREATPEARAVLRVAAVLGRRFEWRLLPDACELVEEAVLAGLTWAVEAQLLAGDQDGEAGGGRFGFRHALTREAVLADVLAPERARLAGRALKAIELAHPGLAGDWCELAADMAEQAGERTRAAQLLLEAGRRSLGLGALATAEAALRRAGWFAADVPALRIDIDEALIEVLALAGRIDQVEDVGTGLLTRLDGQDAGPARRARAHVRLARAAIVASRWDIAEGHLRPVHDLDQNLDPVLLVEADVLGAQLALGQGRRTRLAGWPRPPSPTRNASCGPSWPARRSKSWVAGHARRTSERPRRRSTRPARSPSSTGSRCGACGPCTSWAPSTCWAVDPSTASLWPGTAPPPSGRWPPPSPSMSRSRRGTRTDSESTRRWTLPARAPRSPTAFA
jgi:hypothetical protein